MEIVANQALVLDLGVYKALIPLHFLPSKGLGSATPAP